MANLVQPPEAQPFDFEHFERILAMAYGGEGTWDFSDNDKAALEWVCKRLDSLKMTIHWLEDALATRPDGGDSLRAKYERALQAVAAGTKAFCPPMKGNDVRKFMDDFADVIADAAALAPVAKDGE